MKKVLSVLLSLVIAVSCIVTASAASSGSIAVGSAVGKSGEEISISIDITGNPGMVSLLLNLKYDKSVLKLTKVENGTVFSSSAATFGNKYDTVPYKMIWEDGLSSDNKKTGTLAVLTFKIADNANVENTAVTVYVDKDSTFNYNLKNVSFNVSQGNVIIEGNNITNTSFLTVLKNVWKTIINFLKGLFVS